MSEFKKKIPVWLDCDPGHDDAFAILLASTSPEINLLGISIVHGNDTVVHCAKNAQRFMWTCGIKDIPVYPGVNRPFVLEAKHCPEIHGIPGEQGVAGMCGYHFPDESIFSQNSKNESVLENGVIKMAEIISNHESKVTLVLTGAQTNAAMALRLFPDIKKNIEKIVFMGGAIGLGNTGVAAEFNIEIDPESAHVIFHSGIHLVMVPLEVTHSILVTHDVLKTIADIQNFKPSEHSEMSRIDLPSIQHINIDYKELSVRIESRNRNSSSISTTDSIEELKPSTKFSDCCIKLLTFFQSTYKSVFNFDSPPLHDPCAVYYLINPEGFKTIDVFLDVELSSGGNGKCSGRTLCDVHAIMKKPSNAVVCYAVDTKAFWERMFSVLQIADRNSPLNEQ